MRPIVPQEMEGSSVPLVPGTEAGDFVFVSGQIPRDPSTGDIVGDDIGEQTTQTIQNIEAVLEEAGLGLEDVVKTQVFLTDVELFSGMNEAYAEAFPEPYPSRSAFEIGDLAADILVEIEAIAYRG